MKHFDDFEKRMLKKCFPEGIKSKCFVLDDNKDDIFYDTPEEKERIEKLNNEMVLFSNEECNAIMEKWFPNS